jgi:hypothetical protein
MCRPSVYESVYGVYGRSVYVFPCPFIGQGTYALLIFLLGGGVEKKIRPAGLTKKKTMTNVKH